MADDVIITEYDRDKFARRLWAMSDYQLVSQITQNAADSMKLDFRLPSSRQKADELLKEAKICSEILSERPKRKSALERWRRDLPLRREKAILYLPVGASANACRSRGILAVRVPHAGKKGRGLPSLNPRKQELSGAHGDPLPGESPQRPEGRCAQTGGLPGGKDPCAVSSRG